jgi:ethanolamine transporter EutH
MQFCSGIGKEPMEYKYISRFFDAALDKIGQILKDAQMAATSIQNTLAKAMSLRCGHFEPMLLPFERLDNIFNGS